MIAMTFIHMTAPPKSLLPLLLSFNGGYLDTAGFLSLHGLFVAHVTGNFVTLGAAIAQGGSGAVAKLLALPVFCLAVVALRLATRRTRATTPERALNLILMAQAALLAVAAGLAIHFGGFVDPDGLPLIVTGMALVVAMAMQNAAHRVYLSSAPPSTLMTGTTTQVMIDLADLIHGVDADARDATRRRFRALGITVICFATGCGTAAVAYISAHLWCFVVPPLIALFCVGLTMKRRPDAAAS